MHWESHLITPCNFYGNPHLSTSDINQLSKCCFEFVHTSLSSLSSLLSLSMKSERLKHSRYSTLFVWAAIRYHFLCFYTLKNQDWCYGGDRGFSFGFSKISLHSSSLLYFCISFTFFFFFLQPCLQLLWSIMSICRVYSKKHSEISFLPWSNHSWKAPSSPISWLHGWGLYSELFLSYAICLNLSMLGLFWSIQLLPNTFVFFPSHLFLGIYIPIIFFYYQKQWIFK